VYCDDCQHAQQQIFNACTIRRVAPPIEESTHGLCPQCANQFIENMNKRTGVTRDP
jgi:hypothetical protein